MAKIIIDTVAPHYTIGYVHYFVVNENNEKIISGWYKWTYKMINGHITYHQYSLGEIAKMIEDLYPWLF